MADSTYDKIYRIASNSPPGVRMRWNRPVNNPDFPGYSDKSLPIPGYRNYGVVILNDTGMKHATIRRLAKVLNGLGVRGIEFPDHIIFDQKVGIYRFAQDFDDKTSRIFGAGDVKDRIYIGFEEQVVL